MVSKIKPIPQQAIDLIKYFEGFSPILYLCPSKILTIGYGHALKKGEDEKFKNGITEEEATELLKQDMLIAASAVCRLIIVPLEDYQYAALISFCFNLGSGALQASTLRRRLNEEDYYNASLEFDKWIYGGGRILPGLIRRRKAERILFQTGTLLLG